MTYNSMLALPSKGAIAEPTLSFLRDCGLKVDRPNDRQYTGSVPAVPGLGVLFQRVKDVLYKVADGTVQLGVTGFDVVHEFPNESLVVLHAGLGYGHCRLVVAVPESWVDVESMADLRDIAADLRQTQGRNLRVATTYTASARQFLHAQGIHHFTLVRAEGAIEAAPTIGYADIVVDLVQTGTTLRENHLKPLDDGVIVESQACLVGNRDALRVQPEVLESARVMLEHMDAALNARPYRQLTVNIQGDSAESIAQRVAQNPITRGLQGPTIAPIYSPAAAAGGQWFTVTINIQAKDLLNAVAYLRELGSSQVVVSPVNFVFLGESSSYARLKIELGL
jgi:ATP phosphoribosyltransferase